MRKWLIELVVCPIEKGRLDIIIDEEDEIGVKKGTLRCEKCQTEYPISGYIPRFVKTDYYANTFTLQWKKFRACQLDSITKTTFSERMFFDKTGFSSAELDNALILDVGCGVGRFSEVAAKYNGRVVGIDLSYAVDAAQENMGHDSKVNFIQADIFSLPFKKDIFDYIFSIGVLHHTPDCESAFNKLPDFLKPGGKIAIWVYSRKPFRFWWDLVRKFTTKIPKPILLYLSYLAIPLYYIYQIPVVGKLIASIIPGAGRKNWQQRVLNTFDFYSPKYVSWHTFPEVFKWFEDQNLKNIRILPYHIAVQGQKRS